MMELFRIVNPVIFKCEFCRNAIIYPKKLTVRFCSKQCEKDFYNEQRRITRRNNNFLLDKN